MEGGPANPLRLTRHSDSPSAFSAGCAQRKAQNPSPSERAVRRLVEEHAQHPSYMGYGGDYVAVKSFFFAAAMEMEMQMAVFFGAMKLEAFLSFLFSLSCVGHRASWVVRQSCGGRNEEGRGGRQARAEAL